MAEESALAAHPLEPLPSFYCPITGDVMEDPVETPSGHTFERSAIERWLADGNGACPLTMTALDVGLLRPNIALRRSVNEWKERNAIITISSLRAKLGSSNGQEVLDVLRQLQELCEERDSNRELVVLENYLPVLVGFLGTSSNLMIRNCVLSLLLTLAKDSDDNKERIADVEKAIESIVHSLARRSDERRLAVQLLLELSRNNTICGNIGKVQGCILLLVTISNSDSNQAASDARELLENLSFLDINVVQMAKANYFKPFLQRLVSGSDDAKKIMVTTLADMKLTDQSKATLFKDGGLQPLLHLVSHSDADMKMLAVKALQNLSSVHHNGLQMIREGAVRPLLELLHVPISSSPTLRNLVAATIMNIAVSTTAKETNETFVLLDSDDEVFRLLSLINLTDPNIQHSILRTFYALCQLPSEKDVKTTLRQCSAIQILMPCCESSDLFVRANAVKLLSCLIGDGNDSVSAEHVGQKCLESLLSITRTSKDEEEVAYAMGIICSLPSGDTQITQWLLDADALSTIVTFLKDGWHNGSFTNQLIENTVKALCRFTLSSNLECQKRAALTGVIPLLVLLVGSGTALTKRYAALSLAQFSESSVNLSRPVEKGVNFLCCSPRPEVGCLVHMGVCSVEASFCLLEAGAVGPLVRVLAEPDPRVCEVALGALLTLIEGERLQNGAKVLSESNAIVPIIRLLNSNSTDLQEKTLNALERIFRFKEYRQQYGVSAQMPLLDITQKGHGTIRALAARILAHLNVLHDQSSYF